MGGARKGTAAGRGSGMGKFQALIQSLRDGTQKLQPTDFVPFYQFEKWHKAAINNRQLVRIRKIALAEGVDPVQWGCPEVKAKPPISDLPPKGHKAEILRPFRREYIERCMQLMPAKIEAWREEKRMQKEMQKKQYPF